MAQHNKEDQKDSWETSFLVIYFEGNLETQTDGESVESVIRKRKMEGRKVRRNTLQSADPSHSDFLGFDLLFPHPHV